MYNYTDEQKELLSNVLEKYGLDHQLSKTIEECSELIRAISKVFMIDMSEYSDEDPGFSVQQFLTEIIDVEIMLFQLKLSLKGSEYLTNFYEAEKIRKFEKIQKMMEEVKC